MTTDEIKVLNEKAKVGKLTPAEMTVLLEEMNKLLGEVEQELKS